MANKFEGVFEVIGKDFLKGLGDAVKYALPAERLAAILFPSAAPGVNAVIDATTLTQNAVLLVERLSPEALGAVRRGTLEGALKTSARFR